MPAAAAQASPTSHLFARFRPWHIALAALVLVAIGIGAWKLLAGPQVATHVATVGELHQSVVASGRVMTPHRVSLAAEVTGRVLRIPVHEGETVRSGQLLIELDGDENRASVQRASSDVAQAAASQRQQREVSLPAAEQSLRSAQADDVQAQRNAGRMRELRTRGLISQTLVDDAERNRIASASQKIAAQLQVNSNQPLGSGAALASAALAQAQANLQLAQVRLAHTAIVAPADGTLISRAVEPGDIVQPGRELMQLSVAGETQVSVQLDEKNLAKLALGQAAIGSADAFPQQRFAAVVAYINPGIDATRGSVEVKLRIDHPPAYLRQDMTVSVDIETGHRANAISVPADAIRDALGAAPWVLVVRRRHTVHQPVVLGLRGDDRVEITHGIAAGEQVILVTASGNAAIGRRVRTVTLP